MKIHCEKHRMTVTGSTCPDRCSTMSICPVAPTKTPTCQEGNITTFNLVGCAFDDLNMSGWTIHDANLSGVRIEKANLGGASIVNSRLQGMMIDGIEVTDLLAAWQERNSTDETGRP